jgi:hypothetical protein
MEGKTKQDPPEKQCSYCSDGWAIETKTAEEMAENQWLTQVTK